MSGTAENHRPISSCSTAAIKRYWTAPSSRRTVRPMNETQHSRGGVVFLFDVDNTLLDNDRVAADLQRYLASEVGPDGAQEYWRIFEQLRAELGYADYLGALQRYRVEHPHAPHLLTIS